jgi:hypothetical protein
MTLGWERGIFIFESIKANERKTNGRKMVAQEKEEIRKSLSLTKIRPCLEKEMRTKKARAKKKTWAIEKTVALLSFSLKPLLLNLFLFMAYPLYC